MKKVFFILALSALFAMPSILHAEEIEIFNLGEKFNMDNLPKGQYIICIKKGDEHITKSFIMQ